MLNIAYLISQYPAISHTFILREVLGLRRLGLSIQTASVNNPDRGHEGLTQAERDEASATYYIKAAGAGGALSALWWGLRRSPVAIMSSAWYALRLGRTDIKSMALMMAYWIEALMLWRWLDARSLTHLHTHFASQPAFVAMFCSRMSGIPFSITVHGPDEFYQIEPQRLLEKICAAKFVVCISSFARSQLMRVVPFKQWDKLIVVRLGVDPEAFEFDPQAHAQPAGDHLNMLCVGRLCEAKGQGVLLQAVALLKARDVLCTITLVGNGALANDLKAQSSLLGIEDRCVFAGAVNQDHIKSFFNQADLFVLPSFAEGIPIVLMEAMSLGLPVLSCHVAGIPELIHHGVNGLAIAPGDAQALADAIEGFTQLSVDQKQQMTGLARSVIEQRYHLPNNIRELASVFEQRCRD